MSNRIVYVVSTPLMSSSGSNCGTGTRFAEYAGIPSGESTHVHG